MPRHRHTMRRRAIALALAYVLALQGLLVAFGAVAMVAARAGTGLSQVICSGGGASVPTHRSDEAPPCCPCGPLCGSGVGPALGGEPASACISTRRPRVASVGWALEAFDAAPHVLSDPRKARAPPVAA